MNTNSVQCDAKEVIILLVNGTFGHGSDWITSDAEDSFKQKLKRLLSDQYKIEFIEFSWSEKSKWKRWFLDNTIKSRLKASIRFQERISNIHISEDSECFIVAHSHGGNIVLSALKNHHVRDKINGVVTLGTPFLRSTKTGDLWYLSGFTAIVFLPLAIEVNLPWFWVYVGVYWIVVLLTIYATHFRSMLASDEDDLIEKIRLPDQELNTERQPALKVITTPKDEAIFLLKLTGKLGRAFRFAWSVLNRMGSVGIKCMAVIVTLRLALDFFPTNTYNDHLNDIAKLIDQLLMAPVLIMTSGVFLIVVILRLSYAYDSLPWITKIDTQTSDRPWPGVPITELSFDPKATGFQHSNMPKRSASIIANWIKERTAH